MISTDAVFVAPPCLHFLAAGLSSMMMIDRWARTVPPPFARKRSACDHIHVFAVEWVPRSEALVEAAYPFENLPAHGHVGALDQTNIDNTAGWELLGFHFLVKPDPGIRGIVKEDTSAQVTPAIAPEGRTDLIQEIWGWVTVVVRESENLASRSRDTTIPRSGQAWPGFFDLDNTEEGTVSKSTDHIRSSISGAIVDHDQLPGVGIAVDTPHRLETAG